MFLLQSILKASDFALDDQMTLTQEIAEARVGDGVG